MQRNTNLHKMANSTQTIEWQDLGVMDYRVAWDLQMGLRAMRTRGKIRNRFLVVEHPPVFTMGKRDCDSDFVTSMDDVRHDGIDIVKCDRGGRITYHGPGQLVGYFIFDLTSIDLGVKDFVSAVEDVCIGILSDFNIASSKDSEHPGVWVGNNKIAAIGLNISHGVTQHGFALNVNCDLSHYRHIIACGIMDRGVTTMNLTSGSDVSIDEVKKSAVTRVGDVFLCRMLEV